MIREKKEESLSVSGWSDPVNGISIRASTDKSVYRVDEEIYLTLQYRNEGSTDEIIPVNGVPDTRGRGQMVTSPIYSVQRLDVTFHPKGDDARATRNFALCPVQSQMFHLGGLYVIRPGEVYSDTARLDVWSWQEPEVVGLAGRHASEPLIHNPGQYRISVVYSGNGLDPALRDGLRAFFSSPNPTGERFLEQNLASLSFNEAQRLRPWDWRLWEGELRTEDFLFTIR